MKITALVENTSSKETVRAKHGLSFYIETEKHKILFDLGPDETVIHNARMLNINLADVDTVIISHGHGDHGGALNRFLECNQKASIYVQRTAFEPYFAKMAFVKSSIGLDPSLKTNERLVFVDDYLQIDEEMVLFSAVAGEFSSNGNKALLKADGKPDDFRHEQNLILTQPAGTVLFTGCSHRGIVNICNSAQQYREKIDLAVGGFHLFNPIIRKTEPRGVVEKVASQLLELNMQFYTCHCTGQKAFQMMKKIMGDRLKYISAGDQIVI